MSAPNNGPPHENGTNQPNGNHHATGPPANKPLILILCTSSTAPGHVLPLCEVAKHLVSNAYDVTFVGGVQHQRLIESSGSSFFPVHESLTLQKGPYRKWGMERQKFPEGLPRMRQDFKTFFIGQIPGQFESTKSALLALRERGGPDREILIINETMWFGYLPFKFGAPALPGFEQTKMPKTLGINVTPVMLDSVDTPVMPLGLLPEPTSEAVKQRDAAMRDLFYKYVVNESYEGFRENLRACGATDVPDDWMINISMTAHDTTLQMCDPVLEYPRSDMPAHIKFAGSLPRRPIRPDFVFPNWWQQDVLDNAALDDSDAAKKRIVVISQGTLALDYSMLLAPTVEGVSNLTTGGGRHNILLVVLLGKQGAQPPPGVIPDDDSNSAKNIRVVDFIPYDAILEYADVMIFNGGYGGFTHCVVNGVPMIAAGLTEDKSEVSARVEWAGLGVNLHTGRPSAAQVEKAVDEVLANPGKYRARARKLAEVVAKGKPLEVVEAEVLALTT
ncbi:glycosyltransferase family 1 protein [Apodospora peruviana]|uniref:Glycosyltransferase family 1 protein n=1 Tax=Apodospora peruviana TaxID=516989 RepID=A0AAE0HUF8_9PEZI|nr:glycosyltransferase family 1 protein [Apodospora peruviana]